MNKKWIALAANILDKMSDECCNKDDNTWNFPEDWTVQDKQEIVKAMHVDSGSEMDYRDTTLEVEDWWITAFLAKKLKELAKNEK